VNTSEGKNAPEYEQTLGGDFMNLLTRPGHSSVMSPLQPDIFHLAEQRLVWASERQAVLARNIANLSTPGFQAMDAPAFQQVLTGAVGIQPVRTAPNHMAGTIDPGMAMRPLRENTAKTVDKNGVSLEQQLMKVAATETLHSTVSAIFKKYTSLFNIALGKGS
jgi:flagellar basal-body rod protein FlgB